MLFCECLLYVLATFELFTFSIHHLQCLLELWTFGGFWSFYTLLRVLLPKIMDCDFFFFVFIYLKKKNII